MTLVFRRTSYGRISVSTAGYKRRWCARGRVVVEAQWKVSSLSAVFLNSASPARARGFPKDRESRRVHLVLALRRKHGNELAGRGRELRVRACCEQPHYRADSKALAELLAVLGRSVHEGDQGSAYSARHLARHRETQKPDELGDYAQLLGGGFVLRLEDELGDGVARRLLGVVCRAVSRNHPLL